jgi:hypothetical protein
VNVTLGQAACLDRRGELAATVRAALDALALKLDGKAAAATTTRRKRAVFYNVLQFAVELERLDYNPVDKLRVHSRRSKVVD